MEKSLINQPFKLPHPVSGFTFFAEDQVLTAAQLNQLIHYLDFQDRKTRAWLVGTGIICGLKIKITGAQVILTPGCGLTSDGDLLCLDKIKNFTHFRDYEKPLETFEYQPLKDISGIKELVESSETENSKKLSTEEIKNNVVVLYLESYVKEPDFCSPDNCDNQGQIQHNNLKVLLVPLKNLSALPKSLPEVALDLAEVFPTRPEVQKGHIQKLEDSGGKSGLQSRFTNAISATRKSLLEALELIKKRADTLSSIISPTGLGWQDKLSGSPSPSSEIPGLQNIYAFYDDLCQAYREWRESLFQITHTCTPNISSHPKHLLLGETADTPDHPPHPFRHRFSPAATFGANSPEIRRSQLLWKRLSDLTLAFDRTPDLNGIKILPSRTPGARLGDRAIPAYYGRTYSGQWNVESYLHGDLKPPLSYHNAPATVFDRSGWHTDFYRIEGHIGKPVNEVENELKNLRREYNLSFQILAIQIEDDPEFAKLRPYRFFDLETAYYDHRTRLKLQLSDVDDFAEKIEVSLGEGQSRIPQDDSAVDLTKTRSAAGQAKVHARTAKTILPTKMSLISESAVQSFSTSYINAIDQSHIVNKNIGSIADQVQLSPMDRFVQPEISAGWKLWYDRFKKRKRKIAELSTFEKFVEANHGLEHLGGVPRGGTFIIVYSASKNESQQIVKADFCLPYFSYFDLNDLEEEEEPVEPEIKTPTFPYIPKPWKLNYNWKVATITPLSIESLLEAKTVTIEDSLTQKLDLKIQDNFTALDFFKGIKVQADAPLVNPGKDTAAANLGGKDFGAGGNIDPSLREKAEKMDTERLAIEKLLEAKEKGTAPSNVDNLILKREKSYARAVKEGIDLVAIEATKATATNRDLPTGHQDFMTKVASDGFAFKTDSGRKAIGDVTKKLAVTHKDIPIMADNLKRIGGAVRTF